MVSFQSTLYFTQRDMGIGVICAGPILQHLIASGSRSRIRQLYLEDVPSNQVRQDRESIYCIVQIYASTDITHTTETRLGPQKPRFFQTGRRLLRTQKPWPTRRAWTTSHFERPPNIRNATLCTSSSMWHRLGITRPSTTCERGKHLAGCGALGAG